MYKKFKIISFDVDDTLWINETYYQEIEKEFLNMMEKYVGRNHATDDIHMREIDNLEIYGYGAKGFMLSMLESALHLSGGGVDGEDLNKIIQMGRGLINEPIVLLDGVVETLEKLAELEYKLIVATKGDLLDQERKLRKSGLVKYFDHIEIMSYKREEDYKKLIGHLGIKAEEFLMIGNSMKSDIIPVLNIGGYGFHVPFHTTWAHETVEDTSGYVNYRKAENLLDVISFLA